MIHMPTGQEDFKQLRENWHLLYVDKTYFIKEWWESSYDKVTLITRPRFFGKTLNLSMVDYFFSNQYDGLSYLFRNLFISDEADLMELQGQIPVIFLNFSDIKVTDSDSIKNQIKMKIWQVYMIFKKDMNNSPNLDSTEKEFINSITHEIDDNLAIHSIQTLCCFLSKVYDGKASIVLLDDYDSIFTNSLKSGGGIENFFDEIKEFYFGFLQSTFKDNKFMVRGLITGVMNIPIFESFNGANNIKVYTITSNKYLNCFGFTSEELLKLAELFKLNEKVEQIEKFYKGYKFGSNLFLDLLNPWSISQYLNDPIRFSNYWFITSSNGFVKEILKNGLLNIKDGFIKLIQGKPIVEKLATNILFSEFFDKSEETMWKILFSSGYLTIEKLSESSNYNESSKLAFTLKIPNNEINVSFCELINDWFEPNGFDLGGFIKLLLSENVEEMEAFLLKFLNENLSLFNNDLENIIHAFALGLTVHIKNAFYVKSHKFENDENFYLFLKSLNSEEIENSIILTFNKKTNDEDLPKYAESILTNFNKTKMANHLEKKGVEYEKIKKFSFVFTENELKIHFLSKTIQAVEEEEEEEEEKNEKKKKKKTANNSNFLKDIIIEPKFDHKNKNKLHKNDEIYVIDQNGVDIWEAILVNKVKNNIYEIHYPDFPEDDERIKGLHRILVKSIKNTRIFKKQEEIRNRIIENKEEENDEAKEKAVEEEDDNDNDQKKEEENSIE